jgi:hypothetical protein
MEDKLTTLLERAKGVRMTASQREEQRRSFAYGNSKIENKQITRESINQEAINLDDQNGKKHKDS